LVIEESQNLSEIVIEPVVASSPLQQINEVIDYPDCAVYPPVDSSVIQLCSKWSDYNWQIFEFSKLTCNHSLAVLSQHLFTNANFFETFNIPQDKFRNFVFTIEKGYHEDLPYHNSIHATDVLHCYAFLANLEQIAKLTSDIELLAMYIAAIIHGN
jgi:hypothetical protein